MTRTITLLAFLLLSVGGTLAQESGEPKAADTSSPRDTLRSFIEACNELHQLIVTRPQYYDRGDPEHVAIAERALDCLDDSMLPAFARADLAGEAAVYLKEILDRISLPPWDQIPGKEEIKEAGGLENLSDYRIPDTRITITRIEEGPRRHEYLFSTGTVDRAPRYFRSIASRPYRRSGPPVSADLSGWYFSAPGHPALAALIEKLPENLRMGRSLGLARWKWPGLLVTLGVGLLLMTLVFRAHIAVTNRVRTSSLAKHWLTLVFPMIAILIPLVVKYVAYRYLTLRGFPLYIADFVTILITLIAGIVFIFAASNRIAESIIASPDINPAGLNAQLIRIVAKLASMAAAVLLFLYGGQYLGIAIGTLLASAGIGGVAIALGAQDSLKTLFGTLTLLSDKPFHVGERILFKGYDGVVEDIGLRSTRLRLLSGPQVTLPNDLLAGNDIENITPRPYIRRSGEIHIPLDTPGEKVEQAVTIVRDQLNEHEGLDAERPPRVFFDEFTPTAFRIQFYYWYTSTDFWKFKAYSEKVNFEILR
ncbi:mechanosensitive ion channel family protein, partial [Planctomycetota bacterium]